MIDMPEQEFRRSVVERLNAHDAAIKENTALTQAVADDTAFIRSILGDVAAGARLLCRLAAAWKFLLRQVLIPVVLPGIIIYAIWHYAHHGSLPAWTGAAYKLLIAMMP